MIERLQYIPLHTHADLETENISGVGCILLLINNNGEIYTAIEKEKQGINAICETRKEGEFIGQNIIGALTEEVGINPEDFESIFWVRGLSYLGRVGFAKNGGQVHADVVALYYSGYKEVFPSRNEVTGNGFITLRQLMAKPNLRQAVLPALQFAQEQNFPTKILEAISQGKGEPFMQMMASSDINPTTYVQERSEIPDLINI